MVTALAYDAETLNKKELITRDDEEKVNDDDENTVTRHGSATVSQSKKCGET